MPGQEDEIAAPQRLVLAKRTTERFALQIAVARCGDAGCCERQLHEPRTIDPAAAAPAPQIWLPEQTFRRRHPVVLGRVDRLGVTCVDVAGATYPTQFNGKPILPMEGISLVPAFDDKPLPRDALYWEHEGNAAVRQGDWKLVRFGRAGKWELYDMKSDRTELHDLAADKPEMVRQLVAKWRAWAARVGAKPFAGKPRAVASGAAEPADPAIAATDVATAARAGAASAVPADGSRPTSPPPTTRPSGSPAACRATGTSARRRSPSIARRSS